MRTEGIGGLVIAAGSGRHFDRALSAMTATLDRVVVVLGCGAEGALAGVELNGAETLVCDRWQEGRAACLAFGLARLSDCDAVVVAQSDDARVTPRSIERILDARDGDAPIVRATYLGEPGDPLLLERPLVQRMRNVSGDRGARNLLLSVRTRAVPCDDLDGYGADEGAVTSLTHPRSSSR